MQVCIGIFTLVVLLIAFENLPSVRADGQVTLTPGQPISGATAVVVTTGDIMKRQRAIELLHSIDFCYQTYLQTNHALCLPGCNYVPPTQRPNPRMGIPDRGGSCYLFVP
jgi:hypothetical protein